MGGLKSNNWHSLGFCIRGYKNTKEGKSCQDCLRTFAKGKRVIAVLSDGAGSAEFSHVGSSLLCWISYNLIIKREFNSPEDLLRRIRNEFLKNSLEKKIDFYKLAATLLLLYIDNNDYFVIHVGDGLIAVMKNNNIQVLSMGFRGEFANQTVFITSTNYFEYAKVISGNVVNESIQGFFLMSDGMEQLIYDRRNNKFGNLVYKIFENIRKIDDRNIIKSIKNQGRQIFYTRTYDDISLIIVKKLVN